jgi:hypothetical protein
VAVCGALVVVGVFVTLGCLLALYLELEGFGTPPMPRQLYLASLAFGAVAGLAVPAGACMVLLRGSSKVALLFAAIAAVAVGLLVLGVTAQ